MKNRKRILKTAALLLVLTLTLGVVGTGADESGILPEAPAVSTETQASETLPEVPAAGSETQNSETLPEVPAVNTEANENETPSEGPAVSPGSPEGEAAPGTSVFSEWLRLDDMAQTGGTSAPEEGPDAPAGPQDLSSLLREVTLLDGNGAVIPAEENVWPVKEGADYRLRLRFGETPSSEALQFSPESGSMIYRLPEGLSAGEEDLTLPLLLPPEGAESAETACAYSAAERTLVIAWSSESSLAEEVLASEEASFEVEIPAFFNQTEQLVFAEHCIMGLQWAHLQPLIAEGPDYTILVWPVNDTRLPEDAVLSAEEADPAGYVAPVLTRIGLEEEELESLRVFDLSILSGGEKVEPKGPVRVEIRMQVTGQRVAVLHFPDVHAPKPLLKTAGRRGAPEIDVSQIQEMPLTLGEGALSFETDSFSAYAVVGYQLEKTVIASDGIAYRITVTYTAEAGIPEGSVLETEEVPEEDPRYAAFLDQSAQAMDCAPENLTHSRLFDISILSPEGEKVEPAVPVQVRVEYADPLEFESAQRFRVVHLTEDGSEVFVPATGGSKDGQVDSFTFDAASFSLYGIVSSGETTNLDGKTFTMVISGSMNAMLSTAQNNNTRLSALKVKSENGYLSASGELELWTFISAGSGQYYVQASNGKYLNINGTLNNQREVLNGSIQMSDTPQPLTVTSGIGGNANKVRLTNTAGVAVNLNGGKTANGFYAANDSGANEWFTLYTVQPPVKGKKISAQDLEDSQTVMIYRSVYNEDTDSYEDYVIDGNGRLIRAYDKGDQLSLFSAVSPEWKVIFHRDETTGQLNGYYDFYNAETGNYLCPRSDGTLVSSTRPGVTLNGRRDGKYNSTIESWDSASWAWYGYQVTGDTDETVVLSPGKGKDSQEFSFAQTKAAASGDDLHPVATVDSAAAGITIRMFNYDNRSQIASVTGSDSYGQGVLPANHVRSVLGSDGYPVFSNGKSGSALFSPSTGYYKGTGNNLFLSSVYQSTGYYEYNAFHNFAHYDAGSGNFTVYEEIGTPSNGNQFYFKRGNFFPFNELDSTKKATNVNQYDGDGNALDPQDPNRESTLYLINSPDFYFGMTVDTTFMQPKGGKQGGNPVLYEFNGDDDLWIFIDGVLILDIGGVHDAWPGTINFETGAIHSTHGGAGGATTIKQAFRNAGVFPDGSRWDESRVDEFFRGETFADYSSHKLKMFYMEHGAGASNLEMRFNLPVIQRGRFAVEKELEGTDQQRYANVSFAYQAFRRNENGADIPLTSAVSEQTGAALTFYDNVKIGEKTYDNVFYLKPGESALFPSMPEETLYWVRELGVGTDYYDKITVNDVSIDGEEVTAKDGVYPTSVATVAQRARVIYGNACADSNLNQLQITKRLDEGCTDDGSTFEFRVLLEDANGNLSPYSTGPYMIRNDAGEYFHYVDGKLVSNGQTPIEASVSGNNGTIAGIPADYTVIIDKLLAETDFYVEEIRNPAGWYFENKTVSDCDPSDLPGKSFDNLDIVADGQIALKKDAKVVITNRQPLPVATVISGVKVLRGRDMRQGEFTFLLEPINPDGEAIGSAMTALNEAGDAWEETRFTFGELSYDVPAYLNATYRDADGNALFYYVVRELISENADEEGFDSSQYLYYDLSQYLVVIRLSFDPETEKLSLRQAVYPYDGKGVPADLRPELSI